MAKKLGITMIDMYIKMLQEDFTPLMEKCQELLYSNYDEVLEDVHKKNGKLQLISEREVLMQEVKAIDKQLGNYCTSRYQDHVIRNNSSRMTDAEAEAVTICKTTSPHAVLHQELCDKQNSLIRSIKLSGVSDTISDVFTSLPGILKDIQDKMNSIK